jgi:hypothetical protein
MLVRDWRLPVQALGRVTLEYNVHRADVVLHAHVSVRIRLKDCDTEVIDRIVRGQPLRLLDLEASSE